MGTYLTIVTLWGVLCQGFCAAVTLGSVSWIVDGTIVRIIHSGEKYAQEIEETFVRPLRESEPHRIIHLNLFPHPTLRRASGLRATAPTNRPLPSILEAPEQFSVQPFSASLYSVWTFFSSSRIGICWGHFSSHSPQSAQADALCSGGMKAL